MKIEENSQDYFELSNPLGQILQMTNSNTEHEDKYTLISSSNSNSTKDNSNSQINVPLNSQITSFKQLSFFSRIFFTWTLIAMKVSNKVSLKVSHLLSSLRLSITRSDLSYLKQIWFGDDNHRGYMKIKFCPLLLTIMRANYCSLFWLFCVTFANTGLKFIQIYFLRQLILVFKSLTTSDSDPSSKKPQFSLIPSVLFFLSAKIVFIVVNYQIKYLENMIGRKTSNQIASLIYEKTMTTSASNMAKFSEGEITNFIQIDADSLGKFFFYFPKTIVFPFQFGMYLYMLFNFFGWIFNISFIILIIMLMISFFVQRLYIRKQFAYLKKKDDRMRLTSQTFHKLKVLKLYCWENHFEERINQRREVELGEMKKILNLEVLSQFIHWSIPLILSIVSVGMYTYINGIVMDIADLMTSIDIFDSMSGPLYRFPLFIVSVLNAFISMNRISKFLLVPEKKKQFVTDETDSAIRILNTSFGNALSQKVLVKNVNVDIKKGELIGIIGETGSGKSCLINAMMGYLDVIGRNEFIVNGRLSYSSQSPWIMNETIRNNIIFYSEFNEERYAKVLELCQLRKDIEDFPGRDFTEIGSNGTNISGGQKARISLARSVYCDADVFFFDDPISSVDSFVSMEIFNKLFFTYLKGKTRIIVTNDVRTLDLFDRIIFIEKGEIIFAGKYNELKKKDFYKDFELSAIPQNRKTTNGLSEKRTNEEDGNGIKGLSNCASKQSELSQEAMRKAKLTKEEDQKKGRIGLSIYNKFFIYSGGYIFILVVVIIAIAWQLAKVFGNVWLTKWTETENPNNLYYFLIYFQIGFLTIFFLFLKDFLVSRVNLKLSRKLHSIMVHPLIKAPINLFHDTIPIGQILNRLTHDLERSKEIIKICASFLKSNCTLIGAIAVCCKYNKYCLILSPSLLILGLFVANYYVNAGRDLNRLNGIARSPILSLYSETITGMSTIKAFKVDEAFKNMFFDRLDDYYSVVNFRFGAETWFSMFLELLSVLYIFFILIYAVIFKNLFTAQMIGLLIKYSVSFSEEMLGVLDYLIEIEQSLVSIERCDNYAKITQEKAEINNEMDSMLEKMKWPDKGRIKFDNVSLKYRPELDLTLKNISFEINPQEKIGIVGRTGSGKSSLTLSLFRLVEIENGKIEIDGINIAKAGLNKIRENLTIVPQDPTLFEGNLRYNLDPLHKHKDSELIEAINKVGLFALMEENGRDVLNGLHLHIRDNGDNLSLGEKQLICFARAVVRKSKIIVLDEATASIDHKTEKTLQNMWEKIFKDNTLITIAHRIQTVSKCDKIIVMDNGKVVEFDTPNNLLNKESVFKKLYSKNRKFE